MLRTPGKVPTPKPFLQGHTTRGPSPEDVEWCQGPWGELWVHRTCLALAPRPCGGVLGAASPSAPPAQQPPSAWPVPSGALRCPAPAPACGGCWPAAASPCPQPRSRCLQAQEGSPGPGAGALWPPEQGAPAQPGRWQLEPKPGPAETRRASKALPSPAQPCFVCWARGCIGTPQAGRCAGMAVPWHSNRTKGAGRTVLWQTPPCGATGTAAHCLTLQQCLGRAVELREEHQEPLLLLQLLCLLLQLGDVGLQLPDRLLQAQLLLLQLGQQLLWGTAGRR